MSNTRRKHDSRKKHDSGTRVCRCGIKSNGEKHETPIIRDSKIGDVQTSMPHQETPLNLFRSQCRHWTFSNQATEAPGNVLKTELEYLRNNKRGVELVFVVVKQHIWTFKIKQNKSWNPLIR
jgi:hypothetical protein